jgi:hypothetical protein
MVGAFAFLVKACINTADSGSDSIFIGEKLDRSVFQ